MCNEEALADEIGPENNWKNYIGDWGKEWELEKGGIIPTPVGSRATFFIIVNEFPS